jgi:hypothetical protein
LQINSPHGKFNIVTLLQHPQASIQSTRHRKGYFLFTCAIKELRLQSLQLRCAPEYPRTCYGAIGVHHHRERVNVHLLLRVNNGVLGRVLLDFGLMSLNISLALARLCEFEATAIQGCNLRHHGVATERHNFNESHLYNPALQDCRASCNSQSLMLLEKNVRLRS